MTPKTRLESDLLGDISVPVEVLYGAQTQRALQNFPLRGERTIGSYPRLVEGLLLVKQAAATANLRAGLLEARQARAIIDAARRLLEQPRADQFPVHRLHGGGGTSAHMNVNEVLANLAEELLGGARGQYRLIHPNDHVNLHQSTNDVYPTAGHIAILRQWPHLEQSLDGLTGALLAKANEWSQQPRIARTCLQDGVDVTFGDLFGGYASFCGRARERIGTAVDNLHAVSLGGTIVGRQSDVPNVYWAEVIPALREVTGDPHYRLAANLFDAAQNPDEMVAVSSALSSLARGLIKIAKDFRLMSSGPETGLGEIRLPDMQPGSSIMPGKVNPVIPEFAIQLCFQTLGNHEACEAALEHGELDLNVWESTILFNVLDSMELLATAVSTFGEKCVRGLAVDVDRNSRNATTIMPLLTDLAKRHGYARTSEICKQAAGDMVALRRLLGEQGLL